jgi:hypothetical protein
MYIHINNFPEPGSDNPAEFERLLTFYVDIVRGSARGDGAEAVTLRVKCDAPPVIPSGWRDEDGVLVYEIDR